VVSGVAAGKTLREHQLGQVRFGHDLVVVFDGSRKLRSLPGAIQILRGGPAVGVYSICMDAEERLLPAECQAARSSAWLGCLLPEGPAFGRR
jgi:hypothetical protein